jgi:soluble lytic murein transglycosylase
MSAVKRWALFALGLLPLACRGAHPSPAVATSVASTPAPTPPPPSEPSVAGLPPVRPVLEDPRLSEALARELSRDHRAAALAIEQARGPLLPSRLSFEEECAWNYTLGRLYLAAGDAPNAALAFDHVAYPVLADSVSCELSAYANLRAATAYAKAGDPKTAAQRARAVPDDFIRATEARLALANALADGGDPRSAVPLWRDVLAKEPKTWIDVACRLASALLDGADGPPSDKAAEALDLATRVVVEVPKIETTSGALGLRARALALLPPKTAKAKAELSPEQKATRAKAWLDTGEAKRAVTEAEAVLVGLDKTATTELACNTAMTRAQATTRARLPSAPEAWATAIDRCAHEDALVYALYQGGKAVSSKDPSLATERFAQVEKRFPRHRLADDARFQGALVALNQGDEARFKSMMTSLPTDYPEGDMRGEGLFRVALLDMTKGDWEGAAPLLERIVALMPDDRYWATAGRAAYFRARVAAALGKRDEARERYARVVEDQPLTFYMTQAYDRLASEDPNLARQVLEGAIAREPAAPLLSHAYPVLTSKGFLLGLRLLETGDVEAAKQEIAATGAVREEAESELLWAVALLYDTGGAPEVGHAFARSRLTDYLPHYPAGRYKTLWQVAYPRAFSPLVLAESRAHGLPAALTWAIMREESDFYAEAKSASNAYGLMQIISSTARGLAVGTAYGFDEAQLKRPDASIALGTKYLAGLRADFSGNPSLAIAAYNAGGGAVSRWLAARGQQDFDLWVEQIPFDETRGYIKRVLASEAAYGLLYDRAAFDEVSSIPRRASGAGRGGDAGGD